MLKKLLANLLASILTLVAMVVPLQAQSITLTFNSQVLEPTVAPVMVNGITYIPLRIVADKLGAQTIYTKTSKNEYIEIIKDNTTIKLAVRPEKGYPQVNGKEVSMNVAPKIVNSTTMVPVRFVSENLGCKVDYDSKTNTVAVSENGYVGSGITVKIDDKVAKLTQPAFVKNGVVYVPADIVKELGATIESKVGYVIKRKDIELNTSPLSPVFRVNWTRVPVKSIPKQIGKDLFIPDEILTYMNCDTEYDEATKTLSIINKGLIKVELSQERYVDLTGRVLYPDGTPAKNMKVKFSPTDASGAA